MSRLEEIRRKGDRYLSISGQALAYAASRISIDMDDYNWLLSRVEGLAKAGKKVFTCYSGPDSLEKFIEAVRELEAELRKTKE